ncbi:MAG: GntG family PLP-dependent aldolase [Bacteroidota bacterium]
MVIDLRSDTFTLPTPEMKRAMVEAPLGDDVFGEDPTVNALQEKVAEIFGMEAGLFCPSGTMCNQIGIRVHTQPQDELICDKYSHIYLYEGGGIAYNSMVSVRLVSGNRGILSKELVEGAINPDNIHFPISRLVVLENTCNKGGGSYYQLNQIAEIAELCQSKGLKVHIDGARIFNALIETGDSSQAYGKYVDTISVCLSKGLGAPVGSVLVGSKRDIQKALRVRKVLGGGMRQAGVLAAAGIYALDHHVNRLAEDHKHARQIEATLKAHPCIPEVLPVDTNILIFRPDPAWKTVDQFLGDLELEGIKGIGFGPEHIRLITHLDITHEMVEKVIAVISSLQ